MGTRNLTMVIDEDGETRIAQYGQWDGYPEGQGATCLAFMRKKGKTKTFQKKLKKLHWATKEELDKLDSTPDWPRHYPWLSRDAAAGVLEMVHKGITTGLGDQRAFAGDSLFCEWAYVVDFQKRTFEVYKGFNQSPLEPGERFYNVPGLEKSGNDSYYPVRHRKTWSLDSLPSNEEFLEEFKEKDEDED